MTAYEYFTPTIDDIEEVRGNRWLLQTFNFGTTIPKKKLTFNEVILKISKTGSPGDLSVELFESVSELPSGEALSTGTLAEANISTSMSDHSITMSDYLIEGADLDKEYLIVIKAVSGDASNKVSITRASWLEGAGSYDGGRPKITINGGDSWINQSQDLRFSINGDPEPFDERGYGTILNIATGTAGTRAIRKEYPIEEGLIAGTTKQIGSPELIEQKW